MLLSHRRVLCHVLRHHLACRIVGTRMVLMAGMLPGVECARRRRLRQGGSSSGAAEAPCGTRRPSFCLYAAGHGSSSLSSAASSKVLSISFPFISSPSLPLSVCLCVVSMTASDRVHAWTSSD